MRSLDGLLVLFGVLATLVSAPRAVPVARGLPPLVFVARDPIPASGGRGVPGLGPVQRAAVTRGRLLVRHADGRVTPLIPERDFLDVSHPDVSWDGREVVFASARWAARTSGSSPAGTSTIPSRLP